jgi:tRNA threonylcarbamoyladenosine biosynthesis protein TsaE
MNIVINSIDAIGEAARQFVSQMGNSRVFAFYGSMGAGKTTFIKALCQQMGVSDVITSPTFAIVNEYSYDGGRIFHFDFYRIKRIEEVYDMGYEEYFYSGALCFIEWPELIEDLLPDDAVRISISEQPDGSRTIGEISG